MIAAIILTVSAAGAISLVLGTSSPRQEQRPTAPNGVTGTPTAPAIPAEDRSTPTPEASPSSTASHPPSRSPSPAGYPPVSYEAEAGSNILTGAASVSNYLGSSGGKIVENIGRWGPGAKRGGTIAFPNVVVPADGAYLLTLYAVGTTDAAAQTAVISVSGGATVTVTVAAGPTCCKTGTVKVNLTKGTNTITFGNPDGRAPAIDRIVVSM